MKKSIFIICCLLIGLSGIGVLKSYQEKSMTLKEFLFISNIEVLAYGEESIPASYADCLAAGGNWNMASVLSTSGFEDSVCKVAGKISIFGVELSGSYEKGQKYKIPWATYICSASPANCCIKQGLYSGETKLA